MRGFLTFLFAAAAFALCAQESKTIRCDFTSQPEGASVVVDDATRGVTPLTLFDLGPGRHHVRFEMKNYEPVDDFLLLHEGSVSHKNAVLAPVKGLLLLTTEPEECDISLDGYSLGKTPRLITSLDAKEVYTLVVQKPGYQPRSVEVKFNGRTPLVKHESLIIDAGVIEATSEPADAEIVVNGQPRGTTPTTIGNVPKGRATVTLRKKGFKEETRELSIVPGETETLFVKLEGLPGTMSLSSVPSDARFYVNDQPEGKGPLTLKHLKPGTYSIRVEKEGFATIRKTIELENGGSVVEEFLLANVMGRIEVRTLPGGARVFMDGVSVGTTKEVGDEVQASAVMPIEKVREGEHTIVAKRDGYADATRRVFVTNQQTSTVNVRMKRVFSPDVEIITDSGSYRGVLISNSATGMEVELSPGIKQTFLHSVIRKINFLK